MGLRCAASPSLGDYPNTEILAYSSTSHYSHTQYITLLPHLQSPSSSQQMSYMAICIHTSVYNNDDDDDDDDEYYYYHHHHYYKNNNNNVEFNTVECRASNKHTCIYPYVNTLLYYANIEYRGPARIFGGLRGDHSEAATRMEAAIDEAARREELPFLKK